MAQDTSAAVFLHIEGELLSFFLPPSPSGDMYMNVYGCAYVRVPRHALLEIRINKYLVEMV